RCGWSARAGYRSSPMTTTGPNNSQQAFPRDQRGVTSGTVPWGGSAMTYGDQAFRYRGEGFRDEPDFRPEQASSTPVFRPGTYNPDDYAANGDATTASVARRTP